VKNSTFLQRLFIQGIYALDGDDEDGEGAPFHTLLDAISFKAKFMYLTMRPCVSGEEDEEALLEKLKGNYNLQEVKCTMENGRSWFSDAYQVQLESYLHRNRKLAELIENPALVPRYRPKFMDMVCKAGNKYLYHSLLALSEQEIGFSEVTRERNRGFKADARRAFDLQQEETRNSADA